MDEQQLRIFVAIIQHYFAQETGRPAEVGSPYLCDPLQLPVHDFTGVIGISGNRKGCVYFSSPREILREMLLRAGETDVCDENLADLAGEIANTISGNARREFGHEFLISVPVVVHGSDQRISVPKDVRAYVIPFRWHKIDASLVVSVM
ncbi:MAG: chemotaxis protein CheX [Rhodocyclaceae bacterium]|nr:chemotaxis protein CheX [Rhodocyclaceae bacterium]